MFLQRESTKKRRHLCTWLSRRLLLTMWVILACIPCISLTTITRAFPWVCLVPSERHYTYRQLHLEKIMFHTSLHWSMGASSFDFAKYAFGPLKLVALWNELFFEGTYTCVCLNSLVYFAAIKLVNSRKPITR
mmetsp:Transcript_5484/g.33873  ORF Transcript_5484/g.33873 Transcript_5484/m.33873 type:complete len:133 (-) Transcript_5484:122-520(-)